MNQKSSESNKTNRFQKKQIELKNRLNWLDKMQQMFNPKQQANKKKLMN